MPQYQGIWTLAQAAQLQSTQRWVTDPLFENTTLLLQADNAANGAQNNTFLDSSSNAFAITRNGNTTQGSFTPFSLQPGAWSNFFDGTGDYLSNTSTALITNTVSTFTVESWVYFTATPPANGNFISSFCTLDGQPTGPTNFMSFGPLNDGKLYLFWFDGSVKYASGNTVLALNTWYHIACVVNSNSIQFYVNGIPEVMGNTTTLTNRSGSQGNFAVASSSGGQITGYISNFRVTTTAVYTSRFTPSTIPLTPVTGTVLLTCQSNQFIDTNTQVAAKALTVNGNSAVQAFSPFAPQYQYTPSVTGGSGYFDGSGDYLSEASNAAFDLGGGNFTVEAFIYMTAGSGAKRAVVSRHNSGSNAIWDLYVDTDNKVYFAVWTSGVTATQVIATDATIPLNQWVHVAGGINGTNLYVCANGVYKSATLTITPASSPSSAIGVTQGMNGNGSSFPFTGYISGVRVLKGTAQYTANPYTIPTAPLTAIANTSLLCNFTNAGIYDGTLKNNLETVGNAQVSTSVVKYGTGSMYFDGSGDYLKSNVGTSDLYTFGTGDFTIEMWLYLTNVSVAQVIFDTRPASTNGVYPDIYFNNSGSSINWYISSADRITSSSVSINTWYHVAVCRSGTSTKMFINGTQAGSTYTDTNNYLCAAQRPIIGVNATDSSSSPFYGYIDDLRITKGIARYTANFIPPSVALPRQ